MALKSAEKQQRYRQRHLDHGHKQRLQLVIGASTKAQLIRVAGYHNCTLTKLIETLAAEAELAMFRKLPARLADRLPQAQARRPGEPSASPRGTANAPFVAAAGGYGLLTGRRPPSRRSTGRGSRRRPSHQALPSAAGGISQARHATSG
jgi:hypothetical protein